jgi:tetratricopeptide (TPR) repeat protein/transcriptional regulator with XRE-family HTH domain
MEWKNDEPSSVPHELSFGTLLKVTRDRYGIKQSEVVAKLPATWTQPMYSDVERCRTSPSFEDLEYIYLALREAGVQLTLQDREQFLTLARAKLEAKRTHRVQKTPEQWEHLRYKLVQIDCLPESGNTFSLPRASVRRFAPLKTTVRREIHHLLGREPWLDTVITMIKEPSVKVLVVQGPPGSGKTSELHRLANHFLQCIPRYYVALSEPSSVDLERLDPDIALELLLADVLEAVGAPYASMPTTNLQARIRYVVEWLTRADRPVAIFLDNAEQALDELGELTATWRQFLTRFAQANHQAVLVLASQEWPTGTFLAESQLIATFEVPRFSQKEGGQLLQTLGLRNISEALLYRAVDLVGGIPVCMEWLVRLVREPYLRDGWAEFEEADDSAVLARLLDDPAIFGGAVASRVQPLLDRVLKRLSPEAATALQDLAVAPLPLGSPALRVLYQTPRMLRELREASLLVAYPQRAQLLPMVAAQVRQQLSPSQIQVAEDRIIQAFTHWLHAGSLVYEREAGQIVAELSVLLLSHARLLEAAQILIRYGWLAFHLGYSQRIGRLAYQVIEQRIWPSTDENTCGRIILEHFFAPFIGREKDAERCEREYRSVLTLMRTGQIPDNPSIELHLVHHLILSAVNKKRFEDAQRLFQESFQRLAPRFAEDIDIHASLLERKAFFLGRWSDWLKEHGQPEAAQELFDQTLELYQQCCDLLSGTDERMSRIEHGRRQKRLARILNGLGHRLNLVGQFQEALEAIEQSILLKEKGYCEYGALASSYGESAQTLAGLGRYQEALQFSDKAREEIRRLIQAGDRSAEEEQWVYAVERAKILWQLAQPDEAEHLVQEASRHIHERRREFRVVAKQIEGDIQYWRRTGGSVPCQLDWRWIETYRELVAYPLYDWWKPVGPLLSGEAVQLDQLLKQSADEALQQAQQLMVRSLERELELAIKEQRNPQLFYPALPLDRVRALMTGLCELDERVLQQEINSLVRNLYHEAISEELAILSLVEATALGDGLRFWEIMRQLYPPPTEEEQRYVLSRVRRVLLQGLLKQETAEIAREVSRLLAEQRLVIDISMQPGETEELAQDQPLSPAGNAQRMVRAQSAKRFLEALFERHGWTDWQVVIDPTAQNSYVDAASHRLVLLAGELSVKQVLWLYDHEVQDHVQSAVIGELSRLGLLALGLPGYAAYREGYALYRQREAAETEGKLFDESAVWVGTFGILLANQIGGHPQAFYKLFRCLDRFFLLYRLLKRPDQDRMEAEAKAHELAVSRCLRLFRGKPNLEMDGCWTKDVIYQRGLHLVEQAVAEDPSLLTYLSLGKMAKEHIPLLQELQILPVVSELQYEAVSEPELESLLLSFEQEP